MIMHNKPCLPALLSMSTNTNGTPVARENKRHHESNGTPRESTKNNYECCFAVSFKLSVVGDRHRRDVIITIATTITQMALLSDEMQESLK